MSIGKNKTTHSDSKAYIKDVYLHLVIMEYIKFALKEYYANHIVYMNGS